MWYVLHPPSARKLKKTTSVSSSYRIAADYDFQGKKSEPKTAAGEGYTCFALNPNAELQILHHFEWIGIRSQHHRWVALQIGSEIGRNCKSDFFI